MDIYIDSVTKSFGEKKVLVNFSAVIREKRTTFLMGPSGCGKTTLLNILSGLLTGDSGNVTGVPTKKSAVFQEERLCETFSAIANVRLVCQRDIKNETIRQHLTAIGLEDSMTKPVRTLSGGMRRRVSVVRGILAQSDILFCDEPFKGLDTATKSKVMAYIKNHTKDKTVIIVTHDRDDVAAMNGDLIEMIPEA